MLRFDFMNADEDAQVSTTPNVEDDSASCQSNNGVGKHPLLDTSDPQSTEQQTKRVPSSPPRISCKARGLSKRHNADNAYLEIPRGAPHGLPLRCSDPECASSGRRFRYCQGKRQLATHLKRSHEMFNQRVSPPSDNHSLRSPGSKKKFSTASWAWNGKHCHAAPKRG
jgi:hypothetical protein